MKNIYNQIYKIKSPKDLEDYAIGYKLGQSDVRQDADPYHFEEITKHYSDGDSCHPNRFMNITGMDADDFENLFGEPDPSQYTVMGYVNAVLATYDPS